MNWTVGNDQGNQSRRKDKAKSEPPFRSERIRRPSVATEIRTDIWELSTPKIDHHSQKWKRDNEIELRKKTWRL